MHYRSIIWNFAIAEFVTDLGQMFELVGAVSAVGIAYILPPIIFLKLEQGPILSPRKLAHVLILCLGALAMVASTGSIIYSVVTGQDDDD